MKKKTKSPNKRAVLLIALCLTFHILFWPSVFKMAFGNVSPYVTEMVDIYVPDSLANKFKQELSIDIAEYWVFRLNNKEQAEMEKDLGINNWRIMNKKDVMIVEEYAGINVYSDIYNDTDIYKSINDHKCYVYIFDCDNEIELPNDKGYIQENMCSHWLIFIYDAESNYYYIIHKSM